MCHSEPVPVFQHAIQLAQDYFVLILMPMLLIGPGLHSNRRNVADGTIGAARTRTTPKSHEAFRTGRAMRFNVKYLRRLPHAGQRNSQLTIAPGISHTNAGLARINRDISGATDGNGVRADTGQG